MELHGQEANLRSAVIDIETTDLGAVGAGIVLCVCIRPMDTKRTRTYSIIEEEFEPDPLYGFLEREERGMLERVRNELSNFHILIGHNIERFDIPYLRSRAFRREVDFPLYPALYDTLKAFRRTKYLTRPNGFGKPSGGLAMVADFGGVPQEKTAIYPMAWWESVWANKKKRLEAMHEIIDHCQRDVRMNANVFDFLWAADLRATIKRAV